MENQKSAIGLDGNLAAALGYPIGLIALILIFIEKENKFVRFHAIQSLVWGIICGVVWTIALILAIVLFFGGSAAGFASGSTGVSVIASILGLVALLAFIVVNVGWFASVIYAAVKSYGGARVKMPIAGNLAEKWSS